jgi:SAM-dependent methyltransferase
MDIQDLQRNWDEFGKTDPLWAIMTEPDKRDGKWDRAAFFKTGADQIASAMRQISELGITPARDRCLDFGCGVGRLTQALCDHFDQCCGVDIAPSMIALAEQYNRYPQRCRYYVNAFPDLRIFEDRTFDFVYSCIVLQHMYPVYSKSYIKEFLRILRPGGVLVFQMPSAALDLVDQYRLPDADCRAQLTLDQPPARISPGSQQTLRVRVTNLGSTIWRANIPLNISCEIRIGNHWLDATGAVVQFDDGRTRIPRDVAPGKAITVPLTITAPAQPGQYLLELDVVQELVTWFKDKGSTTLRLPIRNQPGAFDKLSAALLKRPRKRPTDAEPPPQMEMHCIAKAEVIDFVQQQGANVVAAQEDSFCGPAWRSFSYFVTK